MLLLPGDRLNPGVVVVPSGRLYVAPPFVTVIAAEQVKVGTKLVADGLIRFLALLPDTSKVP